LCIIKEKLINFEKNPLLSAWDIHQLMTITFAREATQEGILFIIWERYKNSQNDIKRYYLKC